MRLTQFTDYGLRVLMYLASREDEFVTTEVLAGVFRVSQEHLLKVVRRLCDLGYIEAKRGAHGGVRFVPSTRESSVGSIVRNLEPQLLVECFDPASNTCPILPICGLSSLLMRANDAFFEELESVRIGELVRPSSMRLALPIESVAVPVKRRRSTPVRRQRAAMKD